MSTANTTSKKNAVTTVAVTKEIPIEGHLEVTLDRIDTTVYPNSRKGTGPKTSMHELRRSLKNDGLLQNVVGAFKSDGSGDIGLIAGFRRTEALRQNALDSLTDRYNKDRDLKSGDENYLVTDTDDMEYNATARKTLQEAYPEDYLNALRAVKVQVKTVKVEDSTDAALTNLNENANREDISLGELLTVINQLVAEGTPQKKIAAVLGWEKAKMSQYVGVGSLPDRLRERLLSAEDVPESDADKHLEIVDVVMTELDRRINLSTKHSREAIGFTILRDLDNALSKSEKEGEKKFNTEGLLYVLKNLTRVSSGGSITNESTLDGTAFKAMIKTGLSMSQPKAEGEDAETEEAATDTDTPSASDIADAAEKGKVADSAEAVAAVENAATEGVDITAGTGVDVDEEDADATDEQLLSQDVDVDEDAEVPVKKTEADVAAMAGEREEAPDKQYSMVDPSSIEHFATELLATATEEGTHVIESFANILAANYLYLSLGMSAEEELTTAAAEKLFTDLRAYWNGMADWIKEAQKSHPDLDKFKMPVPKFEGINPAELKKAKDTEEAEDAE